MTDSLPNVLVQLWTDLRDPHVSWQIGILVLCLLSGALLARLLRRKVASTDARLNVMRLGMESFGRVLSPLLALLLILPAKAILQQWQSVALLQLAVTLVGSFALVRFAFYMLRRIFARGAQQGELLPVIETVVATLVWAGVALYVTGLWPGLADYLEQTSLPIGRNKVSLLTILQAAASVIITLIVALWAGALLEERLMKMDGVHSSVRVVTARMGRALFIVGAVLLSLSLVGIDLTVLSVFGGALGVGIGLGLQKLVSSYVSGFVILIERSLALGDIVKVGEFSGEVTRINTRYTVIRSTSGVETVIPNEMLVSGPVQNFSLTDRNVRLATQLCVGYETDIETLLSVLEEAAASVARVAADPAPTAQLQKFGADGFELEIGFWIADPENGRGNVLSDVNRALWKVLQEWQIEVPYPQREIRLLDMDDKQLQTLTALPVQPIAK